MSNRLDPQRRCGRRPVRRGRGVLPALGLLTACWLLALGPAARAQEAPAAPAPRVERITVSPTYLVPGRTVAEQLGIKVGDVFQPEAAEDAARRLRELGMFSEAQVRGVALPQGGVEVQVSVVEAVPVSELNFRGNKEISSDRLREIVAIKPGETAGAERVRTAVEGIVDAYSAKGRPLTHVDPYLSTPAPGRHVLIFHVVEGPKSFVSEIGISGNTVFTDGRIRRAMRSRARGWPPFIRPGRFDARTFQEDQWRIAKLYHDAGYLDARVGGVQTCSPDLEHVVLQIAIYEGATYTVAGIQFEGNTLFRDDELLAAIPLKGGRALRPPDVEESRKVIAGMYGRQGRMDVGAPGTNTLADEPIFDKAAGRVVVRFRIDEGVPVTIRRVRLEGLTRTRDDVVRRELAIHPGEQADTEKIEESERRLRNTGYFDMNDPKAVAITLEPEEGALRDAVVRVKEGQTGMLILGAGVSTDLGLLGQISVREDNFDISNWPSSWRDLSRGNAFRGAGQRAALELTLGTKYSSAVVSFEEPSLGGGPYGLGVQAYSRLVAWEEFDLRRTGASVRMTKRLNPFASAEAGLGVEGIRMNNVDDGAAFEIGRDQGSYLKPFVFAGYTIDRRDNRFVPSKGYRVSLTAELAAADIETIQLTAAGEEHWTVWEPQDWGKHILSLRGRAGVVHGYTGGRVPVFERLYAGGSESLRGFAFRGVSPVAGPGEDQVGGESMLVGSAEYSVPLGGDALRLATFTDFGYVKQDAQDVLTGWDELRAAVGVGVRWRVSFLGNSLVTVDLGFPVLAESDDETRLLSFSLGATKQF